MVLSACSVMMPPEVITPILSPNSSVNQRLLSGPTVMPNGLAPLVGIEYSVIWPLVVTVPMAFETGSFSVNHRLPSGPATIWLAEPEPEGIGYSVIDANARLLEAFELEPALAKLRASRRRSRLHSVRAPRFAGTDVLCSSSLENTR